MDSVNIDLYIDAEEDTEAYCISAGVFRRLMQQNVHVRCYAYQMTAERFSDSMSVSYTHLDVYKRQHRPVRSKRFCPRAGTARAWNP